MKSDMWISRQRNGFMNGELWGVSCCIGNRKKGNKEKSKDLRSTFLMPPWRKKGVGSALIGMGLSYLKTRCKTAFLEVRANNENALNVYKRMGYRVVKEQKVLEYTL